MATEKRNRKRRSTILMAEISYEEPGGPVRKERAVVLNLSENGMLVETKVRYPARAYVRIEVKEAKLKGMASVRYSDPKGIDYRTGLEFSGGLKYEGPGAGEAMG